MLDNNILGILYSFGFIFLVLIIATVLSKLMGDSNEVTRKVVHIMVGHWIFLFPMFTKLWAVILVPLVFVFVNYASTKFNLIKAMERDDDSMGTTYYAVSMLILSGLAFLMDMPSMAYIGLLIMAYGDGFAAVVGQRYGKTHPFSIAPKKSLEGSLTVFGFGMLITLIYFLINNALNKSFIFILLISAIVGVFSLLAELSGESGCDNLSLPIGSGLLAAFSYHYGDTGYFIYLVVIVLILYYAYMKKSITLDGSIAASITAITLYTLGSPALAYALITFFILGSLISKLKGKNKKVEGPRNYKQVLCNSLPAVILVWVSVLTKSELPYQLVAFSVFSGAAADTFSSEIGLLSNSKVYVPFTRIEVPKGLSGGVTPLGLVAGLFGTILLSFFVLVDYGLKEYLFIMLLGFGATMIDSLLGTLFQRKYLVNNKWQDESNGRVKPDKGYHFVTNNVVNMVSLVCVVLIGLLIK